MAQQTSYFSEADLDTIRKYLIGGASAGVGLGLITSYVNYLNRLNKRKEEEDDNTLYVYKKASDESSASTQSDSYLATPVAITGGLLTGLSSYYLIRKLYTALKVKQAQKELDEAQHAFLDASGYEKADAEKETEKSASSTRPISPGELLLSVPVLLPALTATGTAILAYNMLDKEFPVAIKKPKAPKRVEVIEKPDNDQEEYEKQASLQDMKADGIECLVRMALLTKSATSDLANLVAAAATGELSAFEKAAEVIGFINALDTVKGAASRQVDPLAEHIAICTLSKKASLQTDVGLLAAAEFADTQHNAFVAAAALDDHTKECLSKAACCFGRAMRYELSEELGIKPAKSGIDKNASLAAASDYITDTAMSRLLEKVTEHPKTESEEDDDEVRDDSSDDSTDTSGEEANIEDPDSPSRRKKHNKVKFVSSTKSRRGFLSKIDPDIVDKILTP